MAGKPTTALPGQRYGRLVVIRRLPPKPGQRSYVQCLCDCGNKHVTNIINLHHGVRSCGCLNLERSKTHGEASNGKETPEYRCWVEMKRRCYNPNSVGFKHYGGRGIKVCKRWKLSYQNFLADMGRRPSRKHSLDRYPDKDGDYKPSNCRWATQKQQAKNRNIPKTNPKLAVRFTGSGNPNFGKRHSAAAKRAMSMASSARWRGVPKSPEQRHKMSLARKLWWQRQRKS